MATYQVRGGVRAAVTASARKVCLTAATCFAVTHGASVWSMDLLEAYRLAVQQDAVYLAAVATAQAGRERLPQASSQFLPNVSAGVTQNNNKLSSTVPNFLGAEQTTNFNYKSSNQTLQLRQPLFRTYLTAQYRQALAVVQDVEATLNGESQNLTVRVSGAYFEAVLSYEQLTLILSQKKALATQLDAAKKAFAAGSVTRTDVDEAQARYDMALADELEARQNVSFTARQLEALVNRTVSGLKGIESAALALDPPSPNNMQHWIERAELSSPQLISLKAQVEVAQQELKKAQSGHHPTLDAVAQHARSESENILNPSSKYINNTVGFQFNLPLYAGGYVNSTVRQSLAAVERAQQAYEAGRRDLGVRVSKEFRGVTEGILRITALEQALKSAEQLVTSNSRSYKAGSRTVVDVLNAEKQLMLVLRDLSQAKYVYLISNLRLLSLTGEANEDAVSRVSAFMQAPVKDDLTTQK